jgi:hypothetical protein
MSMNWFSPCFLYIFPQIVVEKHIMKMFLEQCMLTQEFIHIHE